MADKDLLFLNECSNEQLVMLVNFILYDKDGQQRYTEKLSKAKGFHGNYPNHVHALLPNIVDELQLFGGNTIINFFRGHGVSYRTVLEDVCDVLKVNYNKNNSTEILEKYMMQKLLIMSVDKMTDEDVTHLSNTQSKEALKQQIGLLGAGSPLYIRLTSIILANLAKQWGIKQAAGIIAKVAGSRLFAVLTGPIGLVISSIWTLFDIAGPAYRVTIPCCITIAYLRTVYKKSDEELDSILK